MDPVNHSKQIIVGLWTFRSGVKAAGGSSPEPKTMSTNALPRYKTSDVLCTHKQVRALLRDEFKVFFLTGPYKCTPCGQIYGQFECVTMMPRQQQWLLRSHMNERATYDFIAVWLSGYTIFLVRNGAMK